LGHLSAGNQGTGPARPTWPTEAHVAAPAHSPSLSTEEDHPLAHPEKHEEEHPLAHVSISFLYADVDSQLHAFRSAQEEQDAATLDSPEWCGDAVLPRHVKRMKARLPGTVTLIACRPLGNLYVPGSRRRSRPKQPYSDLPRFRRTLTATAYAGFQGAQAPLRFCSWKSWFRLPHPEEHTMMPASREKSETAELLEMVQNTHT